MFRLDLIVAFLILGIGASLSAFAFPGPYSRLSGALKGFDSIIVSARGSAPTTQDGVTIEGTLTSSGTALVERAGRPIAGSTPGPIIHESTLNVPITVNGATTFGIFVDSLGRMTVQSGWTDWSTLSSEPAFTQQLPIAATLGTFSITETLDCTSGTLN